MTLFLVKHSKPDIANTTRELSRANYGANPTAFKELIQVIKYVLDMKKVGLKLKSTANTNKCWEVVCFSNTDYAGDLISRRSNILYILCVPVSWQSKAQKSVTLSSSETECIALSEDYW